MYSSPDAATFSYCAAVPAVDQFGVGFWVPVPWSITGGADASAVAWFEGKTEGDFDYLRPVENPDGLPLSVVLFRSDGAAMRQFSNGVFGPATVPDVTVWAVDDPGDLCVRAFGVGAASAAAGFVGWSGTGGGAVPGDVVPYVMTTGLSDVVASAVCIEGAAVKLAAL